MKKIATFFAVLTSSAVALSALPALAEESGADKGGLPQFDATLFPEQLFWLGISFSLLYLLMHFVALPGVERAQDKRKGVIDAELTVAKQANEQAKAMGHEADRALAEARGKANASISEIKAQAAKVAAEQQSVQSKQLNQKLRDAEAKIATARDAALKEIDQSAAELAAAIVESVSGKSVKA